MDPINCEEWIPNLGIQLIKYRCIPSFYSPAIGSIGSPVDPLWIPRKLEFHGLAHISTPRKFVRLFRIIVVIAGITGAEVLIYTSFQSWDESPIKTTIETLPIKEIDFPKLTVCPPKDTFTNLNYGLLMTENITLRYTHLH